MSKRDPLWVCCVIANDAVNQNGRYIRVGPNSVLRIRDAVGWVMAQLPVSDVVWVFGAGTAPEYSAGKTLAALGEMALREQLPAAKTLVNVHSWQHYGTDPEMRKIVRMVAEHIEFEPREVRFVFFTQKQHLRRVQLIWRLNFEGTWGKARFVETGQTAELSPWSEWLKRLNERRKYVWSLLSA